MGDQLLKRIVWIGTIVMATLGWGQDAIGRIDQLVDQIKSPRKGLTPRQITKASDPFVYVKKGEKTIVSVAPPPKNRKKHTLQAIINDRVKIDGRWYRIGEKMGPYRITKINGNSVLLASAHKRIRLTMPQKQSKKIKFITVKE
jgi:hypothetical protein